MTLLAQAFSSAVDSFVIACLDLVPSTKPVFLWSLCLGKAMMYIRNSRQSPAQGFGQVAKVEGSSSLASCELSLIFKWRLRLVLRVGPRPIYRSSRKRSLLNYLISLCLFVYFLMCRMFIRSNLIIFCVM